MRFRTAAGSRDGYSTHEGLGARIHHLIDDAKHGYPAVKDKPVDVDLHAVEQLLGDHRTGTDVEGRVQRHQVVEGPYQPAENQSFQR
jgi:hypothetical protein